MEKSNMILTQFFKYGVIRGNNSFYLKELNKAYEIISICKEKKYAIIALETFFEIDGGIMPDLIENNSTLIGESIINWDLYVNETLLKAKKFIDTIVLRKNYLIHFNIISKDEFEEMDKEY